MTIPGLRIDLDSETVTVVCGYDSVPTHTDRFAEFTEQAMHELNDSVE